MECNWNSGLPWLPEGEQDFPLGAKATSYLPSASELDVNYDSPALPDWMESKEILGLPCNNNLFGNTFSGHLENDSAYNVLDTEDISTTIKPEDMLVPLSELQPEKYGPAAQIHKPPSPPKTSVRVKVVYPGQNAVPGCSTASSGIGAQTFIRAPSVAPLAEISGMEIEPYFNNIEPMQTFDDSQNCNTDALFDELVHLPNNGGLTNLIFDPAVQAGMDDLLSTLESDTSESETSNVSEWNEASTSVNALSPVPSVGSLSPLSTVNESYFQSSSPIMYNVKEIPSSSDILNESSEACENPQELASLLSPASVASVSASSIPTEDDDDEFDPSSIEMHSYSIPSQKRKNGRKSTTKSGSSFPEGRKERKKEQNKQAALRYRQKKKQEDDVLLDRIQEEEKRQKKLKAKYTNLKQELSCLKKIMREVLIAKGTVSPDAFKK